ncbi:hypothetical protein ACPWSR_13075 [Alloiococcus sp. CFN-8]|uniref:hypothetical protein n=1 Tax=Alloiococcus sp. CFN-8 TaxID=3416081 RepID=UPI003CEAF31E
MECLEARIRSLNLEVIDLQHQFNELMDNDFFNFDQAVEEKVDMLLKEINERVIEIYQCFYELHDKLGGSLQGTLDIIWDYGSEEIYAMDDMELDIEDLLIEDDNI